MVEDLLVLPASHSRRPRDGVSRDPSPLRFEKPRRVRAIGKYNGEPRHRNLSTIDRVRDRPEARFTAGKKTAIFFNGS